MTPRTRSGTDDEKAPAEAEESKSSSSTRGDNKTDDKAESGSGRKSSGTSYLNTSGAPVVYDQEGHQVAAGEWTPEVNLDVIGRSARKAGFLRPRSEL